MNDDHYVKMHALKVKVRYQRAVAEGLRCVALMAAETSEKLQRKGVERRG